MRSSSVLRNRFSKASIAYRRWRDGLGARASLGTDPDTKDEFQKQINVSRKRMEAYDQLPIEIRQAVDACAMRLDVESLLDQMKMGWPKEKLIAAINQLKKGP